MEVTQIVGRIFTPSDVFDSERLAVDAIADFRCEKCQDRYPYSQLVVQDGRHLCRINCAFEFSPSEVDNIVAAAHSEAAELFARNAEQFVQLRGLASNYSLMDGISVLTNVSTATNGSYPNPILLSPGGAGVTITATGINFLSTDTLTCSNVNVTFSAQVIATDKLSFTSVATASNLTPRGDYDLLFNGNTWRNAVRVR